MRASGFEEETGVAGDVGLVLRPLCLPDMVVRTSSFSNYLPPFFQYVERQHRPLQWGLREPVTSPQRSGLEGGKHGNNTS